MTKQIKSAFHSPNQGNKVALESAEDPQLLNLLATELTDLEPHISRRVVRLLPAKGIKTVDDLRRCKRSDLLAIPQFGTVSVNQVELFLQENKLSLQAD